MTTMKEQAFLDAAVLPELSKVPGIGEKAIENLTEKGIKTTYQLIGHFLKLQRDENEMFSFLEALDDRKNPEKWIKATVQSLKERVATRGIKCNFRMSDHVIKTATSQFNDAKKTDFLQRKLSGKLSEDFFGIKDESRFKEAGVETTDDLFGEFLKSIDDPDPSKNTDKCDAFYKRLTELGAASGFKSAIIYQIQAKLDIGIDSHGPEALKLKHLLSPLREVPEDTMGEEEYDKMDVDPPATIAKSRTGRK